MLSVHELVCEASDEVNGTRSSKLGLALAVCRLQQIHGRQVAHTRIAQLLLTKMPGQVA